MDDPLAMRVVECHRHFAREPHGVVQAEPTVARETQPQRLSHDEGHRVVGQPIRVASAQQRDDVRMQKSGGEVDLAMEAFEADVARHVGWQDLHDHAPTQRAFLGHEDATHPAAGELTLERVSLT